MSRSSKRTLPARAFSRPDTTESSVDLPAPLEPMSATISPSRMSRLTSQRTCTAPYAAERFSTRSIRPLWRHSSAGALCVLLAEVRFDHFAVAHDLLRRAFGNLLTVVQDDDALAQAHDGFHHVLDHEDRHTRGVHLADQLHRLLDLFCM